MRAAREGAGAHWTTLETCNCGFLQGDRRQGRGSKLEDQLVSDAEMSCDSSRTKARSCPAGRGQVQEGARGNDGGAARLKQRAASEHGRILDRETGEASTSRGRTRREQVMGEAAGVTAGWPGRGRKPRRERSTEPGPGVEAAELLLGDRREEGPAGSGAGLCAGVESPELASSGGARALRATQGEVEARGRRGGRSMIEREKEVERTGMGSREKEAGGVRMSRGREEGCARVSAAGLRDGLGPNGP